MFKPTLRSSLKLLHRTAPSTSRIISYRYISQEAHSKIQSAINATPGSCRALHASIHGVPSTKMKTYNVLADDELRGTIKESSEWPTAPQVYVNGEFVGGCDIVLGMHQSGELETLLKNNDVIPKVEEAASTSTSS